ncbi:hypothetical protein PV327_010604 [Microctonus hyperodae]|uniref:Uncharacterized protein n=1 Tax=Microctonus hyperodae TaxID=165561 RepID=A0AA39FT99_MICHY|nr:hypothetical protein PV327_010604 [Microctonus hyperodae]
MLAIFNDKIILLIPATNANTTVTNTNGVVLRRQKNTQITDEERAMRRVSYLKATWGERMHVDSDLELSDSEPVVQSMRRTNRPDEQSFHVCSKCARAQCPINFDQF